MTLPYFVARRVVQFFCPHWWRYCKYVTPYTEAVSNQAKSVSSIEGTFQFTKTVPLLYTEEEPDYWSYPDEVLHGMHHGKKFDCEDIALLQTSLLINWGRKAWVVVGKKFEEGHAWCEVDGLVLDVTLDKIVSELPLKYKRILRFNDLSLEVLNMR